MLSDLVHTSRSYRRFDQERPVDLATLRDLVDQARLSASASNRQPLQYVLSCGAQTNAAIFTTLAWARLLAPWPGPAEGERPAAYVVTLGDRAIAHDFGVDEGLALQILILAAAEKGLGACILGSVQRDQLRQILAIPERFEILHVVALGMPGETVVLETVGADGNTDYWRDAQSVHHVPKRSLQDVIAAEHGE